jgi:excisionase family DNA binding protein
VKLEVELTDAQVAAIAERVAELVVAREERWLSPKELAAHLGCSVRTILNYQRAGMPHLMVGSHPRFKASDCEVWLTARSGRAYDGVSSNGPAPLPRPGPDQEEGDPLGKQAA